MISYKVLLDTRRTKSGNVYPVVVRVTHDRKRSYFYLGVSLCADYWDSNSALVGKRHSNHSDSVYRYKLFVAKENAKKFALVVNTANERPPEFDPINFKKLLKKLKE